MLAQRVDEFRPEWLDTEEGVRRLDKLTAMAERESRAMSALAVRMRITQQSRYRPPTAGTAASQSPVEALGIFTTHKSG